MPLYEVTATYRTRGPDSFPPGEPERLMEDALRMDCGPNVRQLSVGEADRTGDRDVWFEVMTPDAAGIRAAVASLPAIHRQLWRVEPIEED